MNLQDLTELSAAKLKALSDAELTEILKPYFTVTRPELVVRKTVVKTEAAFLSPEKRKAFALMAEEGIDLEFLRRKRK